MATRGITQLQRLKIIYNEVGGSSRGVRTFVENGSLVRWAEAHPDTTVELVKSRKMHPFVEGEYATSGLHANNSHQICIKNVDAETIQQVCDMLANRSGRKITKITAPILTDTPSIQGIWTPYLSLHLEPSFDCSIVEPPAPPPATTTTSVNTPMDDATSTTTTAAAP